MKMKTYRAYWQTTRGTQCIDPIDGTNLARLTRDARAICRGNLYVGDRGSVTIYDADGAVVYDGAVR